MAAPAIPESLKTSIEGSKVEYVNLGKSGLRVSVPILGAMSIGDPEWAPWVAGEEEVSYSPKLADSLQTFPSSSNFLSPNAC